MNDLIREAQKNDDYFPYSKFTREEQAIVDQALREIVANATQPPDQNFKPYVRTITAKTVDVKKLSDPAYFVEAYRSTFAVGGTEDFPAGGTDEALYKILTNNLVPSGNEPSGYLANLYERASKEATNE